jgi:EmrB/QacA subfamily drug resistance transporter
MTAWTTRQWIALLALSFSIFMISLDVTVVTVALPNIKRDLGLDMQKLQWVVTAYVLSFGALLMAAGKLADRSGRRRVFALGLSVFALASVGCGLASSGTMLVAARIVQGVGAAFMSSASTALVAGTFDTEDRPAAYGVWGAALGLGLAFGPALGGLVAGQLGWHWIFLINAPVALLVLPTVFAVVPEARDPGAHRVDAGGMVVFSSALGLLMYALTAGPKLGWSSRAEFCLLAAAAALFVLLAAIERHHADPLFDLSLFKSHRFLGVSIVPVAASVGYWSLFVYLPFYFDRVLDMAPQQIGGAMLPFTLPMLLMPPLAARLARVLAARHHFAIGLMLIACGDWLLAHGVYRHGSLMLPLLVTGLGAGLINAQITAVAVGLVPVARAGMAAGISATMRQAGYGVGIAGLGAVLGLGSADALRQSIAGVPGMDLQAAQAALAATGSHVTGARLDRLVLVAFTHGVVVTLAVAGIVTLAGAGAAWLLMRGSAATLAAAIPTKRSTT